MAQWAVVDLEETASFFASYGRVDITPKVIRGKMGEFVGRALREQRLHD